MTARLVRIGLAAALGMGLSATVGGCAGGRGGLGTSSSTCFVSLAVAEDAVTAHGSHANHVVLRGIRRATSAQLDGWFRHAHDELKSRNGNHPVTSACVVAYQGTFDSGQVSLPLSPSSNQGPYALVVVGPSNRLLGTFVMKKLPARFAHYFIGGN